VLLNKMLLSIKQSQNYNYFISRLAVTDRVILLVFLTRLYSLESGKFSID